MVWFALGMAQFRFAPMVPSDGTEVEVESFVEGVALHTCHRSSLTPDTQVQVEISHDPLGELHILEVVLDIFLEH